MLSKSEQNDTQKPSNTDPEESKAERDASKDDLLHNSINTEISPMSPTLLAWSTYGKNNISIVEIETKSEFINFEGVKLREDRGWTRVKEIADTRLLVSVHHATSANLAVFDISRREQAKKIYSFEEVSDKTGCGDVAYNSRRRILGAIPVGGKISYHLYGVANGKADNALKLIRKSKWHSQFSTAGSTITSLDFNPNGETVATTDLYGTCLLSDVNTNNYIFHLDMELDFESDSWSRCRWSSNTDEPLLFVKHDWSKLNILDAEKTSFIFQSPIQLETYGGWTTWIDVCPNNGNLLASGGFDRCVKIFDKRESEIVQSYSIDKESSCVRWSPTGNMLASASDCTVLLDFKTGKILYTGKTSDDERACSICFI